MRRPVDLVGVRSSDRPQLSSFLAPAAPSWVADLLRGARTTTSTERGIRMTISRGTQWALVRAVVPEALSLSRALFESASREAYTQVSAAVTGLAHFPIRFWNFVPDMNAVLDAEADRYMAFNVGRYDACVEWLGAAFDRRLATASAVGVQIADLEVHCLTGGHPGDPVENPRQTSAYRYSARYGPRPPCFARATRIVLDDTPTLLIGGTASIVGEDSRHVDNLPAQVEETLDNVSALVAGAAPGVASPLNRLRHMRVYVRDGGSAREVLRAVTERCDALTRLECVEAQICRRELLVELEATADLSA